MNVGVCRVNKCRGKDFVHACSNIADLNTGVSLHSTPVLKENVRHFVGDFAICSIPKKQKDIGEEKTISGNPVGNPCEPSRNQVKGIVNNK